MGLENIKLIFAPYRVKRYVLTLLLGILLISLSSAVQFINTTQPYDSFNSAINPSLWYNLSTTTLGISYANETPIRLEVYSFAAGAFGSTSRSDITSLRLNYLQVYNLSFNLTLYANGDGANCNGASSSAYLKLFGTTLLTVSSSVGTCALGNSDKSIWQIYRNGSLSNISFSVYKNGVYYATIVPTDNNFTLSSYAPSYNAGGDRTATAYADLYFINNTVINAEIESNLITPPNNGFILNNNYTFVQNVTIGTGYLKNSTFYLWYSNGTLLNKTTKVVSGLNSNHNYTIYNIPQDLFFWNVYTCMNSSLNYLTYCSFATQNYTFLNGIKVNSINYSNVTYETSHETFSLNMTVGEGILSAAATLFYNGTQYPASVNCNGIDCIANVSIDIPIATATQENKTFYWVMTIYDGYHSINGNSTTYSQSVNAITLTKCDSGTVALNFTSYDEQNRTRLNAYTFDGLFNYYTGNGLTYKTLTITNSSATEIDVCISQNTTYYINAIIAYNKGTYPTRNIFYQRYTINSTQNKVPLYLLTSGSSTSFILQVQDRQLQAVPQVLVNAQRCYPGLDTNETVFIHRTDSSGLTVGNLEAETALYQFLITNQSQTLLAVTPCAKIIPQTTPYTLLFQLGSGYVSPFVNIENQTEIDYSWNFNKTSNIVTFAYIDTSGIFNLSELLVYGLNMSSDNNLFCDVTNNLSTGIMTCNATVGGTYSAKAYIYRNNQILYTQYVFEAETRSSEAGYYGVFLGIFLIIIGSFAFKFNEIAAIVLINVIVIFENYINLISFGPVFITAMLGVSIIIVGVLER